MGRFDVYSKEIKIEHNGTDYTYELRPVEGKHIKKFYRAIKGLQNLEEGDVSNLDEESMEMLHFIAVKSLEHDVSDSERENLDRFVTQHLMELVEPVIQVNMDVDAEDIDVDVEE